MKDKRATAWWAVVDGTRERPVLRASGVYSAPAILEEAAALHSLRTQVDQLLVTHQPDVGVVRFEEPVARSAKVQVQGRSRVEGVILATLSGAGITVITGALATLGSMLDKKAKEAKTYLDAGDLRGIDWTQFDLNRRESILAATAGLP